MCKEWRGTKCNRSKEEKKRKTKVLYLARDVCKTLDEAAGREDKCQKESWEENTNEGMKVSQKK